MHDLHSHSARSDGYLLPADLVAQAAEQGVITLALTDHDTIDGLVEASESAQHAGIELVAGVEISVTWGNCTLHIVGLAFDRMNDTLVQGLADLQAIRAKRAESIGAKLAKLGVENAHERAQALAGDGQIGRVHFARVLIEAGVCRDMQHAFKHYLKPGRNGFVRVNWAGLEQAIDWIHAAGGLAVLAHPLGYHFSANWRRKMVAAFVEAGGDAMEICTGTTTTDDISRMGRVAAAYGLYGSLGSDFHSPEQHWLALGRVAPLPSYLTPIWQAPSFSPMTPGCPHSRQ